MTRRRLIATAVPATALPLASTEPLIIPVHHVLDGRAKWARGQLARFWSSIWPEAVRDFERCGIRLESRVKQGEVRLSASGKPLFTGLDFRVLNFVITDRIPMDWDRGRGLTGVTTRYQGYHLCVAALHYAHGHQIPLLSVNTCVHELLHALLHDIFESRPKGYRGEARELLIDWYATRLWLFHEGPEIRKAAQAYVERLRSELNP